MSLILEQHLSHPKYRPDIDGLRAMAILSVVTFHAFPNWLLGGFVGVDVFFVISGYLISTIIFENLEKGTFGFVEFYARRIKRIFPALILVLVASYVFGWFALLSDEYRQLGKHIAGGAGFVSNLILWSEAGYFDNASETKPLLHLWSLGIEEQFYLIWPPLLWLAWKGRFNLLSITFLMALVSFYLNLRGVQRHPLPTFYSPHARFWELLSGSLLAWMTLYKKQAFTSVRSKIDSWLASFIYREPQHQGGRTFANVLSFVGLLLLIFGFFKINKGFSFPGIWALVPVLSSTLIISAGSNAWVNRIFLSNRIMVWFGLISYPLYLWHWPLLSFARIIENQVPHENIRIAAVLLAVLLAWITYQLLERPVRSAHNSRAMTVSLVLLMAAVGFIGFYTYNKQGLDFRQNIKSFEVQKKQLKFTQDLGRPSNATIMLLGDSHAAHFVPGLKKEFGDLVGDYTSSGCIPFYGVDSYESRIVRGSCQQAMTEALSYFEKNEKMKVIIISSMGPVYLTRQGFKGMGEERVIGSGLTLAIKPELTDRWEIYSEGLKATLTRLSNADKKVIFVIDVPELDFDPNACLDSRPLAITGKAKRAVCAVSRAEYDNRSGRYKELVRNVLKDFPDVKLYDPTNDLCDSQWCWALKEDRMLYRDNDHLSNEGSYFIVRHLQPLLKDALCSIKGSLYAPKDVCR